MLEDSLIPSGLGLSVPHPGHEYNDWNGDAKVLNARTPPPSAPNKVKVDFSNLEMLFEDGRATLPFRIGAWIVINAENQPARHCRITETRLYPTVKFSEPIVAAVENKDRYKELLANIKNTAMIPGWYDATYHVYDRNFDDLKTKTDKFRTLQLLMDLLPTVNEMKARIETHGTLTSWDKLSPASLGCLRWIISSNRSCIMQIDEGSEVPATREPRVEGFPQWVQFRFASGSPDKEQRFVEALRSETGNAQHPSIFAW
jgi:ubiquitin-conjugating enzyme E2 Q